MGSRSTSDIDCSTETQKLCNNSSSHNSSTTSSIAANMVNDMKHMEKKTNTSTWKSCESDVVTNSYPHTNKEPTGDITVSQLELNNIRYTV